MAKNVVRELDEKVINGDKTDENALLYCPIRGQLNATALAKDGLTPTEEARRIDFINFLLQRKYPKKQIDVETVILKKGS